MAPTLIAAAHGTANKAGRAELARLVDLVRDHRPGLAVELCFIDVVEPSLANTLSRVEGPAVVVPLLLSTGYHVKVDIPAVVADRPATAISAPLGPDRKISRAVWLRLLEARPDGEGDDAVIVIGAGSSDPDARAQLEEVARHVGLWNHGPVSIGQLTDVDPFANAHKATQVANYLLAPGYFDDKLRRLANADIVAGPIGAHSLVVEVILDRYDAAAPLVAGIAAS